MIASSIVTGVAGAGLFFGGPAEVKASGAGVKDNPDANGVISKIASVRTAPSARSRTNDTATFALAAQQPGKLTVGGTTIPRTLGPSNDPLRLVTVLGPTRGATPDGYDFHAFEVA